MKHKLLLAKAFGLENQKLCASFKVTTYWRSSIDKKIFEWLVNANPVFAFEYLANCMDLEHCIFDCRENKSRKPLSCVTKNVQQLTI